MPAIITTTPLLIRALKKRHEVIFLGPKEKWIKKHPMKAEFNRQEKGFELGAAAIKAEDDHGRFSKKARVAWKEFDRHLHDYNHGKYKEG